MFKTIQTIALAALCLNFTAEARQEPSDTFSLPTEKAIRIGDTIPDYFYQIKHQAVNASSIKPYQFSLDQFKNKLIILDFWATWCVPCIYSIKKIDSIQRKMASDKFVIIPVTYHNAKTAYDFLKRSALKLPTIILDTTLKTFFPHRGIPHQIWIKDGRVIAIPKWQYATEENITKALSGERTEMFMDVKDGLIDPKKPLFVKGNGDTGRSMYYRGQYSVIARRLPGFQQQDLRFINVRDTSILFAYNLPLYALLFRAFEEDIDPKLSYNDGSGMYWEISDKKRERLLEGPRASTDGNFEQDKLHEAWLDRNVYGYNLRYPKSLPKQEALKLMQKDLNSFFGIYMNLHVQIERRLKKVAVLRLTADKSKAEKLLAAGCGDKPNTLDRKGGLEFRKKSFSNIYIVLKKIYPDALFSDSTGINRSFKIDACLSANILEDPILANASLAKCGLVLSVEEQMLPVLVIKERGLK